MVVKPESNKLILSLYQIVLLYQAGNTSPRLPPSENKLNNRSIGRDLRSRKLKDSIFDFFSLLVYRSFATYPHEALFFVKRQSSKNHVSIKVLLNQEFFETYVLLKIVMDEKHGQYTRGHNKS